MGLFYSALQGLVIRSAGTAIPNRYTVGQHALCGTSVKHCEDGGREEVVKSLLCLLVVQAGMSKMCTVFALELLMLVFSQSMMISSVLSTFGEIVFFAPDC